MFQDGQSTKAIEIKSGQTFFPEYAKHLETWIKRSGENRSACSIVYLGELNLKWKEISVVPWTDIESVVE